MSEPDRKVTGVMAKLLNNICPVLRCTWHSNRHRKILTFFFFKIIPPFSKGQHFVIVHDSIEELKYSVNLGKRLFVINAVGNLFRIVGPHPQWERWSPCTEVWPHPKGSFPWHLLPTGRRKGSQEASLENPELNQVRSTLLLDAGILSALTVHSTFLREDKEAEFPTWI